MRSSSNDNKYGGKTINLTMDNNGQLKINESIGNTDIQTQLNQDEAGDGEFYLDLILYKMTSSERKLAENE